MERDLERSQDQIRTSLADSIRESLEGNLFGDVMVVGGGISGVQASLDLAASGFKVYLVDKAPAIGGHMAQLDKTFPTNDCSI
jgi:heterodisulfide reductase subunit A-like polyferredoxin